MKENKSSHSRIAQGVITIGITVGVIAAFMLLRKKQHDEIVSTNPKNTTSKPTIDTVPDITVAKWRILEPEDKTDPCNHQITQSMQEGDWTILAASTRGKLHAHNGKWREDAYAIGAIAGCHLLAASDGAGSAPIARVGAGIATREAIQGMKEILESHKGQITEEIIREALKSALFSAHREVTKEAEYRGLPVKHLSATLLLLIHCPEEKGNGIVGLLEIGDGAIFIQNCSNDEKDKKLHIFDSGDHGETAGQTIFLTSRPAEDWLSRIQTRIHPNGISMAIVMTDGVADDFEPYNKYAGEIIEMIHKQVLDLPESEQEQALLHMIGYEQKASFDDRTLLILKPATKEIPDDHRC